MENERATLRLIGFESTVQELGVNSNHFSMERVETGFRKSSREKTVEPKVLSGLDIFKLEGEWETSSNSRYPLD